jgi:glycosyltransferase involved in cell wall biosynthesis
VKIVYNGLFLTRPLTGMGQYTEHLLTELPKALPKAEHIAITPGRVTKPPKGVSVEVLKPNRYGVGEGLALDRWESHDVPKRAQELGADILLTPYPTPPADVEIPVVMTVHDMIPWQLAAYRRSLRSRLKLRRIFEGIRQADHLLTVSKFSRDSIVNLAGLDSKRITIVHDGVGDQYRKRPSTAAINKVRKANKLQRPYVLYIGGYDYRKNVRRLIEAYAASGLAESHDLALAGAVTAPPGALYDDFRKLPELLKEAGISAQTKRLGFVDEADKPALLAGADAFVYPSVVEGFGIPILEALGLGVPVAAGRIPSTQELFPGAVALFNPADSADLAKVLKRTVASPSKARISKGKMLAKKYTWPAAAKTAAAAIKKLS